MGKEPIKKFTKKISEDRILCFKIKFFVILIIFIKTIDLFCLKNSFFKKNFTIKNNFTIKKKNKKIHYQKKFYYQKKKNSVLNNFKVR